MKFIKTSDSELVISMLSSRLITELSSGQPILWLISGGSNLVITIQVMEKIPETLTKNLAITLVDERYGDVGHSNSNLQQLIDAGFKAKQATVVPVLVQDLSLK